MQDELKDIAPEIIERILAHADEFIGIDVRVDEIIAWGEAELDVAEKAVSDSGGTVEDFKQKGEVIKQAVLEKLKNLEQELNEKYGRENDSS